MNILSINTHDRAGGAAKVAYSLHNQFQINGHSSHFIASICNLNDLKVIKLSSKKINRVLDRISNELSIQYFLNTPFELMAHVDRLNPDIVQLHNIHGSYFNPAILPSLTKKYPTVWTLHDMWALTGRCVHSFNCERWQSGCGSCPTLHDYPSLKTDTTAFHLHLKKTIYHHSRITFVVPSKWLYDIALKSIIHDLNIQLIYNGVDTYIYKPDNKTGIRRELGISEDKFIILSSAIGGKNNPYKGIEYLLKGLSVLGRQDVEIVSVGNDEASISEINGVRIIYKKVIETQELMAKYYACSDLFVFPSVAENFPLALLEANSCGLPAVAFNVGGIPEIIEENTSGYLARVRDSDDLIRGMLFLLENEERRKLMGMKSRERVLREFSLEKQVSKYLALYSTLN